MPWQALIDRPAGVRCIAINRAMFDVPNADVFFTEDTRFVEKFHADPRWAAFKGTKVVHALTDGFAERLAELDPSIVIVRRKREDKFWSRSLEEGLSFSSNSGIGALNLADILGADPIHMLGFDCRAEGRYVENYHKDYDPTWLVGSNQAENYRSDFEHWAAPHVRHRSVFNIINPEYPSALQCWPKVDIQTFISSVCHRRSA